MSKRQKVTVVGAGATGATCAEVLAQRDYAEIVLTDIKENLPQGKALDIDQMGAVLGHEPNVLGSNGYGETAGSDVIVITAGLPRSPGTSRDDLVTTNEKIVGSVTQEAIAQSPEAILIVVSNPLDAMCHVAKNVSRWEKQRVFGMAGILDTARFSSRRMESTICAQAAPGAYQADVPSSLTISPPPTAVRSTIALIRSSLTSWRSGTPPTVVALTTGTI